jgi:hypothetical protein
MSDAQSLVIMMMTTFLLSSILGGIGGAVIVSISSRRSIEVRPAIDGSLDVPVQLVADPVALRVRASVAEIEPVLIPITTAPLPSTQELAARILARFPDAGPTDIAEIAGCAKSTAHAIIADYRTGFGAAIQPIDTAAFGAEQ